jgi:hypothetical protein
MKKIFIIPFLFAFTIKADVLQYDLNGVKLDSCESIPLKQEWNQVLISVSKPAEISNIRFVCENNAGFVFVAQSKTSLNNPKQ